MTSMNKRSAAMVKICCFHFGRCGSTLLANMVASQPSVDWRGELFHRLYKSADKSNPWQYLVEPLTACSSPVFGFETKFQHLEKRGLDLPLEKYIADLEELGFSKFVVLGRLNYLRQAVSVARGQQTGRWHYRTADSSPNKQPVRLDVNKVSLGGRNWKLLDSFEFLDDTYQRLATLAADRDVLELSYEADLRDDPLIGYRKLLEFAGVSFSKPKIDLQKINQQSIFDSVSNVEEVASILRNTKYAWMLDD